MGMHVGIIAVKASVGLLQEEFFRTWKEFEVVEKSGLLSTGDEMWDWKESHEEFVSAADWSKENPGKSVYAFWPDGDWAVVLDDSYVLCADDANLADLSRRLGMVLSVVVESASGCAFFSLFENGALLRHVFNTDGVVEAQGEPLPNEASMGTNAFYMDEAEALLASFGLSGFWPTDGEFRAVSIIDRTDYTRSTPAERAETPQGRADVREPIPESGRGVTGRSADMPTRKKPWWKFW